MAAHALECGFAAIEGFEGKGPVRAEIDERLDRHLAIAPARLTPIAALSVQVAVDYRNHSLGLSHASKELGHRGRGLAR